MNTLKRIKLAVLDMAGTTVDCTFAVHDCLVGAFGEFMLHINRDIASASIAVPKPIGIMAILKDNFDLPDEKLAAQIHDAFLERMNNFYAKDPSVQGMPGSSDLFKFLKQHEIKIALDTGFSRPTANVIIERLNWANQIDFSVTSDEVPNGRPYADMIFAAMKHFCIESPSSVVKAGDSPADMQQGHDAGCALVIGVCSGAFSPKELKDAGADVLVEHPGEIIDILKKSEIYV